MKQEYFLAANTPQGFFSYFGNFVDLKNCNRYYVIKGGPGTGKSSMMKKLAAWGESKGFDIELAHCSSDPDSLDGVLIKGANIAMVDGTSPHIVDPKYPGCVDEILNMGEFWNEAGVKNVKNEIIKLTDEISGYYKTAYNYLAAAGELYKNILNLPLQGKVIKNTIATAENFVQNLKKENDMGNMRRLFATSIGPKGVVSYADTLRQEKNYVVKTDNPAVKNIFLKTLAKRLQFFGYDTEAFFDPLAPDKLIEHISVPKLELSILSGDKKGDIIELDSSENGSETVFSREKINELLEKVSDTIRMAKSAHDELERYYIKNMDFEKTEKMQQNLIEKIEKSI